MFQETEGYPNPQAVAFPNKGNQIVVDSCGKHPTSGSCTPGRPCWCRSNFPALGSHRTLNCNSFGICCAFLMRSAPGFVSLCRWTRWGTGLRKWDAREGGAAVHPLWPWRFWSRAAWLTLSCRHVCIRMTGPELPKVSKSQKWRNAPSLDEF